MARRKRSWDHLPTATGVYVLMNRKTGEFDRPPLTWAALVAMKAKADGLRYKFRLPKLDQELDIRDYELREIDGTYLLHRKEAPEFVISFDAPIKMHPAQFILLEGATPELVRELLAIYPELRPAEE